MTMLFARPSLEHEYGFSFQSMESFDRQSWSFRSESFIFRYIQGYNRELFEACGIKSDDDLEVWFRVLNPLRDGDVEATLICRVIRNGFLKPSQILSWFSVNGLDLEGVLLRAIHENPDRQNELLDVVRRSGFAV